MALLARRLLGSPALAAALIAGWCAPAWADHPYEGTLEVLHSDGFGRGESTLSYGLVRGRTTTPLLPTRVGAAGSGDPVTVRGFEEDGRIVGSVSAAGVAEAAADGTRELAVLLVNFASGPSEPWTPEHVRERIFTAADSTNAFFREESHEAISLTGRLRPDGDVFGWYTLNRSTAGCDIDDWSSAANAAAAAAGVSLAGYDHVVYVFPRVESCAFGGAAEIGWRRSWINGDLAVRVVAHELGHNLGLHHANGYRCSAGGQPVATGGACTSNEYDDPYDVMGFYGSRHSHGWHLQKLGLLEDSNVRTIAADGTYTLRSALTPTTEPTTLRIPRTRALGGAVLDWYYLEVRETGGVFENWSDPAATGVSIRINHDPLVTVQSRLIDTNPATGGMWNAPLAVGRTFSDGELSVTTVAAGGGSATVDIALSSAPAADTQPPSAPSNPRASLAATGVTLAWDPSSDDVGVVRYAVLRNGVEVGTSPGTAFQDATAPPGPHAYTVHAEDAASNRGPASPPLTIVVPDGRAAGAAPPPAARRADASPPVVRLRRGRDRRGRIVFSVRARDDARVARVELWIDGRRRGTRRGAALDLRWKGRPGSHRVVARAYDPSGNQGVLVLRVRAQRSTSG